MNFVGFLPLLKFLVLRFQKVLYPPEELAHIAAPFRNDGFPDDLYRHFFLQVGGPIQSIEPMAPRLEPKIDEYVKTLFRCDHQLV